MTKLEILTFIFLTVTILFFFYIDIFLFLKKKIKSKINNKPIKKREHLFLIEKIKEASFLMINSTSISMSYRKTDNFIIELQRLIKSIKSLFNKKNNDWIYGWNKSFLYIGLLSICNKEELTYIQNKFDKFYINNDGSPKFNYRTIHQTPFGMVSILLYKYTNEEKYKQFCMSLYKKLLTWQEEDNTIKYFAKQKTSLNYHFVDELGMIIPFLVSYYKTFNDINALNIAIKNMDYWCKYNLDKNGLPIYNNVKNISIGPNNWGRGCAWFILGLIPMLEVDKDKYTIVAENLLQTLDKLCYKPNIWTQFIGTPSHVDSSSTIPFILLKAKLNKISVQEIYEVLYEITNNKGKIIHCSGETYGINRFSEVFGSSDFIQGIALQLLSTINGNKIF